MSLEKTLKAEAISLGLPLLAETEWGAPDSQGLIDKFKRGIDFCIEHDWPSVDFMCQNFDRKMLNENDVFVNDNIDIKYNDGKHTIILNGDCEGQIELSGYAVAMIWVRHTSVVNIKLRDFAMVTIRVLDNTETTIENRSYNRAYAYRYSNNAYLSSNGQIVVRERFGNN